MTPRKPRVLRNLKIAEISGVDKGAGRGVKIMLTKRDHPNGGTVITRAEVEARDVAAVAAHAFNTLVDMHAASGMTRSAAINKILSSESGRDIFAEAKNATASDVLKAHGASSNQATIDPHDDTRFDVGVHDDDREAERLRDLHPKKALQAFTDAAKAIKAANPHLSDSECHDVARREFPHLWERAKMTKGDGSDGRSPTMLPASHDGNALRPSGTNFDDANRHLARGGQRPHGRA
jgi:hypothetical protein